MSIPIKPLPHYITDMSLLEKANLERKPKFEKSRRFINSDKQGTPQPLMSIPIRPLPYYINDISLLEKANLDEKPTFESRRFRNYEKQGTPSETRGRHFKNTDQPSTPNHPLPLRSKHHSPFKYPCHYSLETISPVKSPSHRNFSDPCPYPINTVSPVKFPHPNHTLYRK